MKINYKKSLKLVILLLTSLVIGFASVMAYSEMFMYGSPITIGTAGVQFTPGDNTTSISSLGVTSGGTVITFNLITIAPGEQKTYDEAVNITNTAGSAKTLNVSLVSLTGQFSTNFVEINVTMIDANDVVKGNVIRIVSSGSNSTTETGGQSIANTAVWRIRWVIKAKNTATNGQQIVVTFKVKVE
jgi:hypothetical protein